MQLKPLDRPDLIEQAATWLTQKDNGQWLDFGEGDSVITASWLKIMSKRRTHVIRLFTDDAASRPIGIVALDHVNPHFRSATVWAVLGDKAFARQGYTTRAVSGILTFGFQQVGLHSVNTWVVAHNVSASIPPRLHFREVGRLRECHRIDGRYYDRILFDLLASEHRLLNDV
ncbi:MAG: GNAT family N-acetyltransferase [Acidobacteria bacterium]|nr:GNAT family N-acetyltransferase [Acidobacteriota bacterium]